MKLQLTVVLLCGVWVKLGQAAPTYQDISVENEFLDDNVSFSEVHARRMRSLMNVSVDPCDNFYEYACGNYPNVIEDLETSIKRSNIFDISHSLTELVDGTLRKVYSPNEEYYEELQIAKKFVDNCATAELYPTKPSAEYLEVLKSIGGFPAIDPAWNESSFDWFNMTAHLTRYGVVGMVDETIIPTYPFEPYYKLPKLGFGFNVYLENIATNESDGYVYNEKIMRSLLKIYGVSESTAKSVIEEVFELLRDIMELQTPLLEKDLVRSDCMELSRRDSISTRFDKWNTLFDIAWAKKFYVPYSSYCPCNWFYNKLDELAGKKPKAFANYMALKFLSTMHLQLKSKKFQRRQCVLLAKSAMPLLFSHFYIKEHFTNETAEEIDEMMQQLTLSMHQAINRADWLSEWAQLEALKKLKNMRFRIGHITDPISRTYIKQIRRLNVTDNVASNILQLAKFTVDMKHYGHLRFAYMNNGTAAYDILDAVRVRAFYMTFENVLSLLAGILHPPVYHQSFPMSLKYGALGYIIGHEIGHGFEGYGFRVSANLSHSSSWLSHKSEEIVKQRSKCFADDYTNFDEPDFNHRLSGNRSIDEILSDSIGLKLAFIAYRRILKNGVKHSGEDFLRKQSLPGLNSNPEQTFFLSFAQLYCAKYEPRNYWAEAYAKHPLQRYRVMGTLRNSEEFSKVFSCSVDSPMNPERKCHLW